jgi:hypothetical protein
MLKFDNCTICGQLIQEEWPRFHFPKLPIWHDLSKYHGVVHIDCLHSLPNTSSISKTLADIYENFYGSDSATPVVTRAKNIVIKDCRSEDACFEVYDFDDFAEFFIPVHAVEAIQQLIPAHFLTLGIQGLQVLHRADDGTLSLEIKKPHFIVDLPEMTHESLVNCLLKAKEIA